MSTVPSPRRRAAAPFVLAALTVAICIVIAVAWSELAAGLGLAVAVLAWLAPRPPNR